MNWVAVVPVKGGPRAKSRLGALPARAGLAEAFALDTVAALVAAAAITHVYVVTAVADTPFETVGAQVVPERPTANGDPLNDAIAQGVDAARRASPTANIAVVTGDLPALTPSGIDETLRLAEAQERSMIPDEEGTGTTVLLALAGVPLTPRFGPGSRAAHEADGHVPLPIPATARIRRDVDTPANLAEAVRLGVGPHTHAALSRSAQPSPPRVRDFCRP